MRRSGKVSIAQVVVILVLAVAGYVSFMYFPVLTHRMALGTIARECAAKMLVDFNDGRLREEIFARAKAETGVQLGMSEMFLLRDPPKMTVTLRWTEQIRHPWGKNHVLKMSVTESAQPGAVKFGRNAE